MQTTSKKVENDIKKGVLVATIKQRYPIWYLMHKTKLVEYYKKTEKENAPKNNNEKTLSIIPAALQYEIAKQCDSVFFSRINEISTYENENVVFESMTYHVTKESFMLWKNNLLVKIRRGYKIILYDPKVIYITYDTLQECRRLINELEEYIDFENSIHYKEFERNDYKYIIQNNILHRSQQSVFDNTNDFDLQTQINELEKKQLNKPDKQLEKISDFEKIIIINNNISQFDLKL